MGRIRNIGNVSGTDTFSSAALVQNSPGSLEKLKPIAVLEQQLHEAACDIAELDKSVSRLLDKGFGPEVQEDVQQRLHAFAALTAVRTAKLSQEAASAPEHSAVLTAIRGMRLNVNAIRYLPLADIREAFPSVVRSLWQELGKVSLCSAGIHIREYDGAANKPSPDAAQKLSELCSKLVIDSSIPGPQEGFGRQVPAQELTDALERKGARLFVLSRNNEIAGFYIILTDRRFLPASAEASLRLYEQSYGPLPKGTGWLDIVGILPAARVALHRQGVNAYAWLSGAMAESALACDLKCLLGEVRVGDQANLAVKRHLAVGLSSTGVVRRHDGYEYEVLRMDPRSVAFLAHEAVLEEASRWQGMGEKSGLPSLGTIFDQLRHRDPGSVNAGEICVPNGDRKALDTFLAAHLPKGRSYELLSCCDGLAVQIRGPGGLLFTLRQIVHNQDMWTCDFSLNSSAIMTFADAFDLYRNEELSLLQGSFR